MTPGVRYGLPFAAALGESTTAPRPMARESQSTTRRRGLLSPADTVTPADLQAERDARYAAVQEMYEGATVGRGILAPGDQVFEYPVELGLPAAWPGPAEEAPYGIDSEGVELWQPTPTGEIVPPQSGTTVQPDPGQPELGEAASGVQEESPTEQPDRLPAPREEPRGPSLSLTPVLLGIGAVGLLVLLSRRKKRKR